MINSFSRTTRAKCKYLETISKEHIKKLRYNCSKKQVPFLTKWQIKIKKMRILFYFINWFVNDKFCSKCGYYNKNQKLSYLSNSEICTCEKCEEWWFTGNFIEPHFFY